MCLQYRIVGVMMMILGTTASFTNVSCGRQGGRRNGDRLLITRGFTVGPSGLGGSSCVTCVRSIYEAGPTIGTGRFRTIVSYGKHRCSTRSLGGMTLRCVGGVNCKGGPCVVCFRSSARGGRMRVISAQMRGGKRGMGSGVRTIHSRGIVGRVVGISLTLGTGSSVSGCVRFSFSAIRRCGLLLRRSK